jgi:diacylglycerol kinase family enzyme
MDALALGSGTESAGVSGSVSVLLNTSAGAAARVGPAEHPALAEVQEAFAAAGLNVSIAVGSGDTLTALARRAVARGVRVVVAGGGDGTIGTVASALVNTDAALGILPLGTLNHFAKDLGIPLGVPEAVRVIAAGGTARVDVGEVNGRVFINNSSLGLYPSLVYQREKRQARGRGKWIALALAAARVWRLYRRVRVAVHTDAGSRVIRTPFVFVGNNEYQLEGVRLGCRARVDAGQLHVAMAPGMTRGEMVRVLGWALLGRLPDIDHLDTLLTDAVTIGARRRRVPVALDGEVALLGTPLEYRIRSGALRVCVPTTVNGQRLTVDG